ncbi:MAG: hypothetical protein Q9207_008279, partial [Kuettlingeria erythrocarpa]
MQLLPQENGEGLSSSWTYDSLLLSYSPRRLIVQVLIVNHVMENVICHVADNNDPSQTKHESPESRLFDTLAAAPDHSAAARTSVPVQTILSLCRSKYGHQSRPCFGNALFAHNTAGEWQLVETMDPLLLRALSPAPQTFRRTTQSSLPPSIPRSELSNAADLGEFFSPQTSKVVHKGLVYVGKHPCDWNRLDADFAEVENALNLPRPHPNLLPGPQHLVTASPTDDRVCGFLIAFYPNGDLYQWSRKLFFQGRLKESLLREWAIAIASAMDFLLGCGEWHGDLKPDNVFVGEQGDLVLADRTRTFATIAFASPELLDDQTVTRNEAGQVQYQPRQTQRTRQYLGLPEQWPLEAKEKSEVYAYGVLLLVLVRQMSLSDVYRKAHEAGSGYLDWSVTSEEVASFPLLAEVIGLCVRSKPQDRPTFA